MLAEGVLQNPQPEAIFALHTFPILVGQVGLSAGLALAGMDEFRVRLYSPSGDLTGLTHKITLALRDLSTAATPTDFTSFNAIVDAMQANNIHSQTVFVSCWPNTLTPVQNYHLMGLVSVPDPILRAAVHTRIREVLDRATDEVGASYDLTFTFHNPPVINDTVLVHEIMPSLESTMGKENVLTFKAPYPFAHEDFALYQQHIPGVFLWLGIANPEKGITSLLHQADFDIDEDALVIGTRLAAMVLVEFLAARFG
jgi:amidohydrolase